MQTEVYCSHLKKDVYFVVEQMPFFKVLLHDAKTNEPILTVTIPKKTDRVNCGYADLAAYPWLFDFLQRSRLAKATHRRLYKFWGGPAYAEFEFDVDSINGNAPIPSGCQNVVAPKAETLPMGAHETRSKQPKISKYYTKAVGVTFGSRQKVISRLKVGQSVRFVLEPGNPYDRFAVKIETLSGEQIGYVAKDFNRDIFNNIKIGRARYEPVVSSITGGGLGKAYGVNLQVTVITH